MPQGRKKVPYSGKAKKEQLKAKRHKITRFPLSQKVPSSDDEVAEGSKNKKSTVKRYALKFFNESRIDKCKKEHEAEKEIVPVTEKCLEISSGDLFGPDINFPKRPDWSYDMSYKQLLAQEHKYFTEYIKAIEKKCDINTISYFELNLENWRQLWRVIEMSDIILVIVDIRYSAALFPPCLYDYVTNILHKDMILVLNKIDLAPPQLVVAWKNYFQTKYPDLHIVLFTTIPGYNLRSNQNNSSGLKLRLRKGRQRMTAEGAQLLLEACKKIVGPEIDLTSWEEKIKEELNSEYKDDEHPESEETLQCGKGDTDYVKQEKYKNGIVTIGCIGHPNVGKSSLMNAIIGKKVVSVSKTPGHTKHFQTIFLTPNVKLCDCPGLVFPSRVPKPLQVIMGSYPISQLRDPYTSIRFLAERIDLPSLLKIPHPRGKDSWSVMDVCNGWAKKRSFFTAWTARFDCYRAANNILRMCLDGKICLCLYPPGYLGEEEKWKAHEEVKTVEWIQSFTKITEEERKAIQNAPLDSSDDEESEESESESASDTRQVSLDEDTKERGGSD